MDKKKLADIVYKKLAKEYPDAHCALDYNTPFQLLIATILSAQCTDKRVNIVTKTLFKKYPTPEKMAKAQLSDIEEIIRSTGFFRNKAKNILACSQSLVEKHKGQVPQVMDDLVKLGGVGRKTANVVLGNAFNINEGVVVDTHVKRITNLLGLTKNSDPVKIEKDLVELFKRKHWTMLSHLLIFHGRKVCIARRPRCQECILNKHCPSSKAL